MIIPKLLYNLQIAKGRSQVCVFADSHEFYSLAKSLCIPNKNITPGFYAHNNSLALFDSCNLHLEYTKIDIVILLREEYLEQLFIFVKKQHPCILLNKEEEYTSEKWLKIFL